MNIAIIPARSGSKRIAKKNIINFFGKPIIYYSIKNLKESNLFDKIFVSTDCIKTENICRKLEIDILKRPKYLCGDKVTTEQIILFHFKSLIKIYKNLSYGCCMYATAPLINNEDLINAYKIIKSFKINSVFPVSKYDFPIHQALKVVKKGNYAKPLFKKLINKNSQELDEFYHDSGTFYLFNVKSFLEKKKLYYKNKVIILPNSRSQDINEISDLKITKLKYLSMNKLIKQ